VSQLGSRQGAFSVNGSHHRRKVPISYQGNARSLSFRHPAPD
jgi:hypothetical protein